jgi:hypothetical protein
MTAPLLTYRDAYEHLLDVQSQVGKAVGAQERRLRRAVIEAYRLLTTLHDWKYFKRFNGFNTEPPQTLPDAAFDASELTVTLSSGLWPANAKFGVVDFSGVRYPVRRRVSDTVVELERGPTADYAGQVIWRRFRYLLPVDVGEVVTASDTRQNYGLRRVRPEVTFWWTQVINTNTLPLLYSLVASPDTPARWELWLSGSGDTERHIEYYYFKRHTTLNVDEVNNGLVSITGDVATFSSSVLDANRHVGCVLRVSPDATLPTSQYGRYEKNPSTGVESNVLNPASIEVVITAVNSATEAVISDSASATSKAYTISSHIDLNQEGMWEMFLRLCEEQYGIVTRSDTAIRNVDRLTRLEAMRSAMAADSSIIIERNMNNWRGRILVEPEDA